MTVITIILAILGIVLFLFLAFVGVAVASIHSKNQILQAMQMNTWVPCLDVKNEHGHADFWFKLAIGHALDQKQIELRISSEVIAQLDDVDWDESETSETHQVAIDQIKVSSGVVGPEFDILGSDLEFMEMRLIVRPKRRKRNKKNTLEDLFPSPVQVPAYQ